MLKKNWKQQMYWYVDVVMKFTISLKSFKIINHKVVRQNLLFYQSVKVNVNRKFGALLYGRANKIDLSDQMNQFPPLGRHIKIGVNWRPLIKMRGYRQDKLFSFAKRLRLLRLWKIKQINYKMLQKRIL